MIKSISYWSMPPGTNVEGGMRLAKKTGFAAIELAIDETGEFSLETTADGFARIKGLAERIGIKLPTVATGLGWAYPVVGPDPAICDKGKQVVRKCLEAAQALGAGVILCVPGSVTDSFSYDAACEQLVPAFQALGDEAADYGVVIGLENVWNKFMLSPVEFARLIDDIDRPCVQAYFDVGNVMLTGFPDQWIRILGSRIRAVHFKDFKCSIGTIQGFIDLLEGDVPWDRVMAAFKAIGYDGAVTAEMMPPYAHFPERLLEATSQSMDAILTLA
ncbi:MAG: sugar phosphate isomerase/epimerase [Armatimonadetes bacterium]|nr:sugar phosphate isomerase/epimerase [Armatimonadota bacterium]